jgi:cell division initiation protein
MKIAPIDIAHKTFARKVMGIDADEVTDFLRDIADQMEELIRERNTLKENMRQKEMTLMEYKERDDSLKQTIHTATKMSDQIRVDAEREAKLIINDAQHKADMILKDSRDSLKRVYTEIADLKRTRMQFEVNLRSLCQAHLAMLEQSHLMMPDPQININPGAYHSAQNAQTAQAQQNINQQNMGGGMALHSNATPAGVSSVGMPYAPQSHAAPPMGLGRPPTGKA